VEYESYIKNYGSLRGKNLNNRNLKIIDLKNKGWIKDFKRGRYLSGLYNRNNGIKIEFI